MSLRDERQLSNIQIFNGGKGLTLFNYNNIVTANWIQVLETGFLSVMFLLGN